MLLGLGLLLAGGRAPLPAALEATQAAARVEPGRAFRWLSELQAACPDRWPDRPGHAAAPAFVANALASAGAREVRLERLVDDASGQPLTNVLGRVPGRDRSWRVVLAAHHDSVPGAPGAVDDGGAVAAILEATRALSAGPAPACDVELAIFDLEESGLIGSRAHLRALGPAQAHLRAALAVELVGWHQDRLVLHTFNWGFQTRAEGVPPAWLPRIVRAAGAAVGQDLPVGDPRVSPWYQATVRVLGLRTGSDADAYLAEGVPACLLSGSSLANFYAAYHRPSDDLGQVDPTRLDDAARVIAAAAHALAAMPPEAATRAQGEPYLVLGAFALERVDLALIGLSAAAPLVLVVLAARRARARGAALAAGAGALALVALALAGSLFGLLVTGPLALSAALAATLVRGARAALYPGLALALLEAGLIGAAAASFGFRWQGSPLETAATLLGASAALALGALLVRRGPAA